MSYRHDAALELELERLQRRGDDLSRLRPPKPLTQERKDKLRRRRAVGLSRLKLLSAVMVASSMVGIVIGVVANRTSAPNFPFPHAFPGAAVPGGFVLVAGLLWICTVRQGRQFEYEDTTGKTFRCLSEFYMVVAALGAATCFLAAGISGVWALSDCSKEDDTTDAVSETCRDETKGANVALAVLTILITTAMCVCCFVATIHHFFYKRYFGFTSKSRYEALMKHQRERAALLNEMNSHMALEASSSHSEPLVAAGSQEAETGSPIMFQGKLHYMYPAENQTASTGGTCAAIPAPTPSAPPASTDGLLPGGHRYHSNNSQQYEPEVPPPPYETVK